MILLDSLYINNSGGKVLLDYLVQEVEKSGMEVFYLFDDRCKSDYQNIPADRKIYLKASLWKRHLFYKKNGHLFSKVFCFGNLAPSVKLKVPVYTYFHQRLFIEAADHFNIKECIIFKVKSYMFRFLSGNTDTMMVQTGSVKASLNRTVPALTPDRIVVLPFYPPLRYPVVTKEKNTFIYVSGGSAHKNHQILLDAFVQFYDQHTTGKLILTVPESSGALYEKIAMLQNRGYPIDNLGFISHDELGMHYAKAAYSVYPSTSESFGLGILEALEGGCKIMGSDMEYLHAVCVPSLTFDPDDVLSVKQSFEYAVFSDRKETKQIVRNEIDRLIQLLKEQTDENPK